MKKRVRLILVMLAVFAMSVCFMTAVSAVDAPKWVIENMMRTDKTPGIRFSAKVAESLREDEKLEEYGFIIAAWDKLEESGVSVSSLCHEADVTYALSVNYKAEGEDKADVVFATQEGGWVVYACVITNIPEEHYRSGIVAKPYIKYDGEITYGASFRVNYLGAAGNMLKSDEFANLSDEEKALVESVANYGKEEDGELEIEEEPGTSEEPDYRIISGSDPYIDENNYYRNYYSVFNLLTGQKETSIAGITTSATASGISEAVAIGSIVSLTDGMVDDTTSTASVIDTFDGVESAMHEIDDGQAQAGLVWILGYNSDDNTLIVSDVVNGTNWYDVVETGSFEVDENTVVTLLESAKSSELAQWGTFSLLTTDELGSAKNDYRCYNWIYASEATGDSKVFKQSYAKYIKAYIIAENNQNLAEGELNKVKSVTFVVNDDENELHLVSNFKPEETPDIINEYNYRIISGSDPYIDENNYYRNYYSVLNLLTGQKETNIAGITTSATASGISEAVAIGSIVSLTDGMVDDTTSTASVVDTFDGVESAMHEIDDGQAQAGLVWILGYNSDDNTLIVSDVVNGTNWYDVVETGSFEVDENTVVTLLESAKSSELAQWGTFSLLTTDELGSDKNYYRCYNNKISDDNGNYKTGYAKYIKAYIVTENKQNLEDGELNKVIFATIVVNGNENFAHLTTNKQE